MEKVYTLKNHFILGEGQRDGLGVPRSALCLLKALLWNHPCWLWRPYVVLEITLLKDNLLTNAVFILIIEMVIYCSFQTNSSLSLNFVMFFPTMVIMCCSELKCDEKIYSSSLCSLEHKTHLLVCFFPLGEKACFSLKHVLFPFFPLHLSKVSIKTFINYK